MKDPCSESALRALAEPVAFTNLGTTRSKGDAAFAENLESPHYETLEERIAAELWRWRALPEAERATVCANRSTLASAIEFYLCRLFELENSSASSTWWCDGVFELDVTQRAERRFLLFGAAYWAEKSKTPFYLAPFELEFEFAVDDTRTATRIVGRFGRLDEHHRIVKTPRSAGPGSLIARRPTCDQDWAFAVELS